VYSRALAQGSAIAPERIARESALDSLRDESIGRRPTKESDNDGSAKSDDRQLGRAA
jgi:hypothetical protein